MTALTSDTFVRANSTTTMGLTDGTNGLDSCVWSPLSGTWGINSNQAYVVTSAGAITCLSLGTGDVDLSATFAVLGPNGSRDIGIAFRANDANNYWTWELLGGTSMVLRRISQASSSTIASVTVSPAPGDVLRVVAVGPIIKCYYNGVLKAQTQDAFNVGLTKHGLRLAGTGSLGNTGRFSSWSASSPAVGEMYSRDKFARTAIVAGSTDGTHTTLDPLAWTVQSGNIKSPSANGLGGGAMTCTGPAAGVHLTTINLGVADARIQVTPFAGPASGVTNGGLVFRYTNTSNYLFVVKVANGDIELWKREAGVDTRLGLSAGYGTSFTGSVDFCVLSVQYVGSVIRVFRNGLLVITATSSFNSSATICGLYADDKLAIFPSYSWVDWMAWRPLVATANVSPIVVGGRGIYVDEVAMGPGTSTIIPEPNWSLMSGYGVMAFKNSMYGIMWFPGPGNSASSAPAGQPPPSTMFLYRVDLDPTSVTGYKFTFFPNSIINDWNKYTIFSSSIWFANTQPRFAIDDRTIVFSETGGFNSPTQTVRILKRLSNNTLAFIDPQLSQTSAGTSSQYWVPTNDGEFARGVGQSPNDFVQGIRVDSAGICTVVSTANTGGSGGTTAGYQIFGYDATDGFLLGGLGVGLGNTVFARAWNIASGFTAARIDGTLLVVPNGGGQWIRDGRESLYNKQFVAPFYASFNGTAWVMGAPDGTPWPFPNAADFLVGPNYGDYLSLAPIGSGTSFRVDYARVGQTNAAATLLSRLPSGIDYAGFGYQSAASVMFTQPPQMTRHTRGICVVFGSFSDSTFTGNSAYRKPIAFATQ